MPAGSAFSVRPLSSSFSYLIASVVAIRSGCTESPFFGLLQPDAHQQENLSLPAFPQQRLARLSGIKAIPLNVLVLSPQTWAWLLRVIATLVRCCVTAILLATMTKRDNSTTKNASESFKKGGLRLHDKIMGGPEASSRKVHPQLRTSQKDL